MVKSSIKEIFDTDIKTVWNVIINNRDYAWRSDLSRIEITDENNFIEYTKDGFLTYFKITKKEPYQYEFDVNNKNMTGHWTGILTKLEDKTEIEFIEEINVSNPIMKLLAKTYLKKQQKQYIKD